MEAKCYHSLQSDYILRGTIAIINVNIRDSEICNMKLWIINDIHWAGRRVSLKCVQEPTIEH